MTLAELLKAEVNRNTENGKFYQHKFFLVPRIYCKDGFNISIQCNHASYCASENGYREYGQNWVRAEWGFPSEAIDGEKYDAEDPDNTTGSVGCSDVELLQSLIDEHGGMDFGEIYIHSLNKTRF